MRLGGRARRGWPVGTPSWVSCGVLEDISFDVRLRAALEWIEQNLADTEFDLGDLARVVGMSRFHFARAFRPGTAVPPWRFFTGTASRGPASCRLARSSR